MVLEVERLERVKAVVGQVVQVVQVADTVTAAKKEAHAEGVVKAALGSLGAGAMKALEAAATAIVAEEEAAMAQVATSVVGMVAGVRLEAVAE